ncbi:MAG: class I poly(R)-hydroxyalkanoic acid synthase [Candidatus Eremiobacteraeota bacterium]|nr:class I poly(R)-hydroxyalkanoic acid synthase [Candidatus Eremiobacteraeota bacterium]
MASEMDERPRGDEPVPASGPAADPLDPLGIGKASLGVWQALAARPDAFVQTQMKLATAWMSVAQASTTPPDAPKAPPVIEPARNDSRFKHPAWTENPTLDALKQGYLLATQAMLETIERAPGIDDETRGRVAFFAKQFCDAMSPTNVPFMNPAVVEETLRSGGRNFQRGAENVLDDIRDNDGRPALVDKSAFTVGTNVATSKGDVVFRNELIEVIHYAATTETVHATPLLIVPPWINKFYILDLQPANSLIKYATDGGIQTFVVSWRNPDASLAHLGFEDYLHLGPLAAADAVRTIASSPSVNQIGYCIGGTLTAMELAYLAKTDPSLVGAVTFFAALTDFTDAGDIKHFIGPEARAFTRERVDRNGVLDASNMADTFNMLRSNDLIWNVAINRYLLGRDAPAFDLLYWNSDATRLPAKMHREYLENMYARNALARGELSVAGTRVDLRDVKNDVYTVASREDHIAPWRSVYRMTQLFSGDTRFRLGHSGHIAGIINAPGAKKGKYWASDVNAPDPEAWLAAAEERGGSWWPDWLDWLRERSGDRVAAPAAPGSAAYPPLAAAPGTYVLEKS